MLRDNSQTCHIQDIGNIKGLTAGVIIDIPDFDHTFSVACNKCVHVAGTVYSNQRRVMTIQSHNVLFAVWIPYEYLKVKPAGHEYFVSLAVRNLSYSLRMSIKYLCGFLCKIIV